MATVYRNSQLGDSGYMLEDRGKDVLLRIEGEDVEEVISNLLTNPHFSNIDEETQRLIIDSAISGLPEDESVLSSESTLQVALVDALSKHKGGLGEKELEHHVREAILSVFDSEPDYIGDDELAEMVKTIIPNVVSPFSIPFMKVDAATGKSDKETAISYVYEAYILQERERMETEAVKGLKTELEHRSAITELDEQLKQLFSDSKLEEIHDAVELLYDMQYMQVEQLRKALSQELQQVEIYREDLAEMTQTLAIAYEDARIEPGEAVGHIATDAISAPAVQLTLDTFHSTGSLMNVNFGLDQLQGILHGSEPKNPSMIIHFEPHSKIKVVDGTETLEMPKYVSFEEILTEKRPDIRSIKILDLLIGQVIDQKSEILQSGTPWWYSMHYDLYERLPEEFELKGPKKGSKKSKTSYYLEKKDAEEPYELPDHEYMMRLELDMNEMYISKVTQMEIAEKLNQLSKGKYVAVPSPVLTLPASYRDLYAHTIDSLEDATFADSDMKDEVLLVPTVYIDIIPTGIERSSPEGNYFESSSYFYFVRTFFAILSETHMKGIDGISDIRPGKQSILEIIKHSEEVETEEEFQSENVQTGAEEPGETVDKLISRFGDDLLDAPKPILVQKMNSPGLQDIRRKHFSKKSFKELFNEIKAKPALFTRLKAMSDDKNYFVESNSTKKNFMYAVLFVLGKIPLAENGENLTKAKKKAQQHAKKAKKKYKSKIEDFYKLKKIPTPEVSLRDEQIRMGVDVEAIDTQKGYSMWYVYFNSLEMRAKNFPRSKVEAALSYVGVVNFKWMTSSLTLAYNPQISVLQCWSYKNPQTLLGNVLTADLEDALEYIKLQTDKKSQFRKEGRILESENVNMERAPSYAELLTFSSIADAIGYNMPEIWKVEGVDPYLTFSNNMNEILTQLGVEAARNFINSSIVSALFGAETSADLRHITLLADFMTKRGTIDNIQKSGLEAQDVSALSKATLQTTVKVMATEAALGNLESVKSNYVAAMWGQSGSTGTGFVRVENTEEYTQLLKEKMEKQAIEPEELENTLLLTNTDLYYATIVDAGDLETDKIESLVTLGGETLHEVEYYKPDISGSHSSILTQNFSTAPTTKGKKALSSWAIAPERVSKYTESGFISYEKREEEEEIKEVPVEKKSALVPIDPADRTLLGKTTSENPHTALPVQLPPQLPNYKETYIDSLLKSLKKEVAPEYTI